MTLRLSMSYCVLDHAFNVVKSLEEHTREWIN